MWMGCVAQPSYCVQLRDVGWETGGSPQGEPVALVVGLVANGNPREWRVGRHPPQRCPLVADNLVIHSALSSSRSIYSTLGAPSPFRAPDTSRPHFTSGGDMSVFATHLDELLIVLRASEGLHLHSERAENLRTQLASRLDHIRPELASRIRALDDWHAEVLADFIAEAFVVASALDHPPSGRSGADDTRVG